jgi:diaminohydroxyphosphoribosylaminopyrimidine deaminase/5-amino-6-(5-phosphoribosylamino)uracil reductase
MRSKNGVIDLRALMRKLAEREITCVLIEGGGRLIWEALKSQIADKVMFFTAPKIIGGKDSVPSVGGAGVLNVSESFRLKDMRIRKFKDDLLLSAYIEK